MSKRNEMANIITGIRIWISALLLFSPALSPAFYSLYLVAGFTDIIDGAVARATNTAGQFGSKLDTFADFVFTVICLIKLLPIWDVPIWLYWWIAGIATIKIFNIALGYIGQKRLIAVHSVMNKVTGVWLFLLPLTALFVDWTYSAIVGCILATAAAIQEGYVVFITAFRS